MGPSGDTATPFTTRMCSIELRRPTGQVRRVAHPRDATHPLVVHEAAYLARSIPAPGQGGTFSSTWATYAVTDDVLYTLSIDGDRSFNASFVGCSSADDVPFQFNASALAFLGEFTDVGGGVMTYWALNGTTSAAAPNGTVAHGAIAGVLEEYEAPCL